MFDAGAISTSAEFLFFKSAYGKGHNFYFQCSDVHKLFFKSAYGKGHNFYFQCSDVHKLNDSQRCAFVNITDDCQIDEGFIDYTYFVYCDFSPKVLPLGLIILVNKLRKNSIVECSGHMVLCQSVDQDFNIPKCCLNSSHTLAYK